jgi:3-hydroxyisobutyrate dehydrogenase-like beta-hydroxyacid dehydrogenase
MVISILTDAKAVDQVYGEMLSGDVKGKLFVEMSTVRPQIQKDLNERVKSKNAVLIECPVGGTIGPGAALGAFSLMGAGRREASTPAARGMAKRARFGVRSRGRPGRRGRTRSRNVGGGAAHMGPRADASPPARMRTSSSKK